MSFGGQRMLKQRDHNSSFRDSRNLCLSDMAKERDRNSSCISSAMQWLPDRCNHTLRSMPQEPEES